MANLKPWHKAAAPLLLVVAVVLALFPGLGPKTTVDRLQFGDQRYFWAGVNYPWKSYQDFGTGAWGHSGVSEPITSDEIDTDFANMEAQGIKLVKWRVFNDGRYGPTFDDRGFATGLAPEFIADMDAALALAEKHDLYLVFTLFNSQLWTTSCVREGVRFGWGPQIMVDPARRAALLHNGVEPFLRHIGSSDRVVGFEVIAEPEWGINELHTEQDYRQKVPLNDVRSFVRDVTRSIHSNTRAIATVESNRPTYMPYWRGLGLDYYSFSWYDWMAEYDPLDVPASSYGLDKPVALGEFPVATSEYYTIDQALEIAHSQGYAGAFAWSFAAGDQFSKWAEARLNVVDWLRDHWNDLVKGKASEPPDRNAAVQPPPYALSQPRFHVERGVLVADVDISVRGGGDVVAKFFLYPGNSASAQALAEREYFVSAPDGKAAPLSAVFDGLKDGQQYKLSLGIFDQGYNLVKWFDGLSVFSLTNGEIELPKLTQEQIENPCYGISE